MGKEQFKEHLMKFDLTRQEAAVYESSGEWKADRI